MSINRPLDLGWCTARGDHFQIGLTLGQRGHAAVHQHLISSELWRQVTDARHQQRVARMSACTQQRFPFIWQELLGMAEGLALPVEQVMAWNCRGDLLASVPDGCTTVLLPGEQMTIAHNEDGLPFFRGSCFIADVQPDDQPGFRAFCYPGSLPGHTFAMTDAGLLQAVNNLRLLGVEASIPRMVLGRAVLACQNLAEAVDLLRAEPDSGGFHFSLAQQGHPQLLSIEFGDGHCSVREVTTPSLHANHALHLQRGLQAQIITDSSRDRQQRGEILVDATAVNALSVLRDSAGPGLPIWRDAIDDPDDENTLATAVMQISAEGITWSIYDHATDCAAYHSG